MKLEELLEELKESWDYTQEEMNDIREYVQKYGSERYWEGYDDGRIDYGERPFTTYGRKEDW